ncbi:hypothetical protein AWC38_SpisGene19732 [Stylophora pistillata]|uniref:Phospholipase A2-like domain-containing protein n=1 Tax=Stylophora pistillata TaxID=50429 RepID=A0A2B4RID7_STYPI|nr:hypothetical protein AWC38_SpisGene19732 [Stylophora pistillata]
MGSGIGTILASVSIPMAIDLAKNLITAKGAPRMGGPPLKGGKGAPRIGGPPFHGHGAPRLGMPPPFIGSWPNSQIGRGAAKAIKSDYTKKQIKQTANKYLDQALESFTNDLSEKISGGNVEYSQWYPMEMYAPSGVYDPTNRFYKGGAVDIHKMIGKLPKPKDGWSPSQSKYMGPYNSLDQQLVYDKNTGEVIQWNVKPYNKVDETAAYHDIRHDMAKDKGDYDRQMVKSLDQIPYMGCRFG